MKQQHKFLWFGQWSSLMALHLKVDKHYKSHVCIVLCAFEMYLSYFASHYVPLHPQALL